MIYKLSINTLSVPLVYLYAVYVTTITSFVTFTKTHLYKCGVSNHDTLKLFVNMLKVLHAYFINSIPLKYLRHKALSSEKQTTIYLFFTYFNCKIWCYSWIFIFFPISEGNVTLNSSSMFELIIIAIIHFHC